MAVVRHKEAIHSGHFMVSDFEAEAEEEEEDIPASRGEEGSNQLPHVMDLEEEEAEEEVAEAAAAGGGALVTGEEGGAGHDGADPQPQQLIRMGGTEGNVRAVIDLTLDKLFRSMSIAYRQKLTSPKWNRFRGLKLTWKDKIRLNNVIWRCWHMQFIKGLNRGLLCAFANPLEIDNHACMEGGTLLEGKYWKRKLRRITQEYTRWRLFYKQRGGHGEEDAGDFTDQQWDLIFQAPQHQLLAGSKDDTAVATTNNTEMDFLMDALLSSLEGGGAGLKGNSTLAAVQFPNPREINRLSTNPDFIQPGLQQLQPALDDFFNDLDNQPDFLSKLPIIEEDEAWPSTAGASGVQFAGQQQQQPQQQQHQRSASAGGGKGKAMVASSSSLAAASATVTSEEQQQTMGTSSYGGGDGQQQQQLQQQMSLGSLGPQPETSMLSANMPSYRMDLQQAAVVQPPPPNAQVLSHLATGSQQQQQQYLDPPPQLATEQRSTQATVMDLASAAVAIQQQQQQQSNSSSFGNSNNLYPPYVGGDTQKKMLGGSNVCNSQKRHSPKHRILHHRDFSDQAQPALPALYEDSAAAAPVKNLVHPQQQFRSSGLQDHASPYSRKVVSASSQGSNSSNPPPYVEPKLKTRSHSGPSAMAAAAASASAMQFSALKQTLMSSPQMPPSVQQPPSVDPQPTISGLHRDSDLVQLLTAAKARGQIQQMQMQQQQRLQVGEEQQHQQQQRQLEANLALGSRTLDSATLRHLALPSTPSSAVAPPPAAAASSPAVAVAPTGIKTESVVGFVTEDGPLDFQQRQRQRQELLMSGPAANIKPSTSLMSPPEEVATTARARPPIRKSMVPVPPVPLRDQPKPPSGKVEPSSSSAFQQHQEGGSGGRKGGSAEQRRRGSIKNGFDELRALIPTLSQNSSVKVSKAALLHKAGDHLQQLKAERASLAEENSSNRAKVEALKAAIAELHKEMGSGAATAGSSSRGRAADTLDELQTMFDEHVLRCTRQNWKYWAFSLLMAPQLASFQSSVDASSYDEFSRTFSTWTAQHMSLPRMRPTAVAALTDLTKKTDFLLAGAADKLPEQAMAAAVRGTRGKRVGEGDDEGEEGF